MSLDRRPWVWDASPLVHAARADRLDLLVDLAQHRTQDHRTTSVVRREVLDSAGLDVRTLPGFSVDARDDVGWYEAVEKWAVAPGVASRHRLAKIGTLGALCDAARLGHHTEASASAFVRDLAWTVAATPRRRSTTSRSGAAAGAPPSACRDRTVTHVPGCRLLLR
ncbi:hypothetical protein [Pseudokineococcus sp. 1T1Z-3]|uniref:hypothetical protein n=1 Tax=Pseudokineococcus sp. 1T1Z-3 TaxID=3132745 RepID=UPI0030AEF721